jgi:hypothetical protein
MRRFVVLITLCLLLMATLLAVSGPAAAADVTIYANTPSDLRTGPVLPDTTWTFTYLLAGNQTLIGAGVPATVYIMEHRTQRVAAQFDTTMLPGSGVLSLTPQWTCKLRVGWYDWTLWPTFSNPATTFLSMSQSFRVVKRL